MTRYRKLFPNEKLGTGMEEKGSMMNRTIKAAVGMVAIAAMSVGTLAACGGSSSSSDNGKGKVYFLNFKPESNDEWQKLAKDYTKETGVEVKVQTAASGTYEQTLKSEIAKSEAPTLFQVNGPVGYQNWKKYTADMSNTDVYKELANQDVALKDGDKVVGVPYVMETYGLIYNKDILNKYFALDGAKATSMDEIDNFDTLKALYAQNSTASHDLLLLSESFSRTNELTTRAMMGAQGPNVVRNEKKPSKSYLLYDDDQKTWDEGLDKEVLAVSLKNYKEHIADVRNLPAFYTTIANEYGNDYRRFVDDIWSKTVLMKNNKRIYFNNKAFDKDPGVRLGKDLKEVAERLKKALGANTERIEDQERMLCAAKLRMEEDMPHYSDANFTMRLSYGRVGGYNIGGQPSGYYTASESIVEKMKAGDKGVIDYQAEPIMHELMSASNYGPYADKTTGKMQLCLLTNNDITGGNSGSPLFDGQGRLIGLAFDGNWDSLASDIMFDKVLARTISVDIRFVLYLMDRWGHADRLLQEIGAK